MGIFYSEKGTILDSQNDVLRPKPNAFTYYRETKRWSDEKCSAFVIILSFPQRCDALALKSSLVVVHKIAKNSFGDQSQEVELS